MSATTFTFSSLLPAAQIGLADAMEAVRREGVASAWPVSETLLHAADAQLRRSLDIPMTDVFAGAWEKTLDVGTAIRRSRKSPGKPEIVKLTGHEIVGTEHPELVLELNGVPIGSVRLDFEFKATLEGVILGIVSGALATAELGQVKFKLSLKLHDGVKIVPDWEPKPIRVPGVLTFNASSAKPSANLA